MAFSNWGYVDEFEQNAKTAEEKLETTIEEIKALQTKVDLLLNNGGPSIQNHQSSSSQPLGACNQHQGNMVLPTTPIQAALVPQQQPSPQPSQDLDIQQLLLQMQQVQTDIQRSMAEGLISLAAGFQRSIDSTNHNFQSQIDSLTMQLSKQETYAQPVTLKRPLQYCNAISSTSLTDIDEKENSVAEIESPLYGHEYVPITVKVTPSIVNEDIEVVCVGEELKKSVRVVKKEKEAVYVADSREENVISKRETVVGDDEVVEIGESLRNSKAKEVVQEKPKEVPKETTKEPRYIPPPYQPTIPFPGRFKKQLVAKYKGLYDEQMARIEEILSLDEATKKLSPLLKQKYLAMLKAKEVGEGRAAKEEVPTKAEKFHITKLGDPGRFTLTCGLKGTIFKSCLCDLGSSINLLPLSTAKSLGYTDFKPSQVSLTLADGSIKRPLGALLDVPIMMEDVEVPTDFLILDVGRTIKDSIILGRPFLASVGAVFDAKEGTIELRLSKGKVLKYQAEGFKMENEQALSMEDEELSLAGDHNEYDGESFDGCSLLTLFEELETTIKEEAYMVGTSERNKGILLGPLEGGLILKPYVSEIGETEYKMQSEGNSKPFALLKINGITKKVKGGSMSSAEKISSPTCQVLGSPTTTTFTGHSGKDPPRSSLTQSQLH